MRLPRMRHSGGWRKAVQMQFGGYKHLPSAGEGEIYDMENLSSDLAPLLATRKPRKAVRAIPGGSIGGHDKLYWVEGTTFYYDGESKGTVAAGEKQFAGMGQRIIIWPDKLVYHTGDDKLEKLEASVSGTGVKFDNGELFGEKAECNSIVCAGVDFKAHFSAGDAVEITGCTKHPENNKTPIIREISEDGHTLRFYEYVFTLEGTTEKPVGYTEPGTITFARKVPDMDYICVNENRLWGCKGDTVYASKLGDPKNFNVFDGVDTDSFWVEAGSAGSFTGCVSFLGYPVFFKESSIHKMYGDLPSNFQLMASAVLGVQAGEARSLAIAGETLYYLSTAGIMAYTGGIPACIGGDLGEGDFHGAVAGSDGLKYYVSMHDGQRQNLFVWDTRRRMWHREDDTAARGFARVGGDLYLLARDGQLMQLGAGEEVFPWAVEFGDFTEGSPDAKGYGKLQLRMELEAGSTAKAEIRYDSRGPWQTVGQMESDVKRTWLLPIIPRRADHYRIRITGRGGAVLYSLARQMYGGSETRTF